MLSEKKILNETKNHNPPPPFKLNGRSLIYVKVIAPHMTKDVIDNYMLVQSPIKSCDELMYINQSNRFLGLSQQFFTCTSYFLLISVNILNVYCYYFILFCCHYFMCIFYNRRGLHISWYNLLCNPIMSIVCTIK